MEEKEKYREDTPQTPGVSEETANVDETENTDSSTEVNSDKKDQEQSVTGVIIHSFFIIPFLIAVVCVMMFFLISLLVREPRTIYDYINDVKAGGSTKRWQSAFELSKILANPKLIPPGTRFVDEMIAAYNYAKHPDDYAVRYYLSLAMGATHKQEFVAPLLANLQNFGKNSLSENQTLEVEGLIKALGFLQAESASETIKQFLSSNEVRVRLSAVMALGHIGDKSSIELLKLRLDDDEVNVQWDAAIALAKMDDASGKDILLRLLDREYYKKYRNVSRREQAYAIMVAMEAASKLGDAECREAIAKLAKSDRNMKVRTRAMKLEKTAREK